MDTEKHSSEADEQEDMHGKVIEETPVREKEQDDEEENEVMCCLIS